MKTAKITFRDREHFYNVVHHLNKNVGRGSEHWKINGKVLKHLRKGQSVTVELQVFSDKISDQDILYYALI